MEDKLVESEAAVLEARNLTVRYRGRVAVKDVSLEIPRREVTAIIGPSGCGKTTLIRAMNRMSDFTPWVTTEGEVLFLGEDIYARDSDPVEVRRRIGMVFQEPNPFPMSIFENISWGPEVNGFKGDKTELVQTALERAALWDEVKDKLGESGRSLSGGQQQRLCIARAIAMEPEVILMDEPCSALDPISTARIEELVHSLKEKYTIVFVTHNLEQAARVSGLTAVLMDGEIIEHGPTSEVFTSPKEERTRDYILGGSQSSPPDVGEGFTP